MAELASELLLGRLISLIVEEGKLLGGIGRDVEDIKNDLEIMRSFLQDADSRAETDQVVKPLVEQVRELAYDAEDVLDKFLLRLVRPRHRNRIFDSLLHKLHDIKHLKTRHRFAGEIQTIKARLENIYRRRQTFIGEGRINGANTRPNEWSESSDPRIEALHINEAQVVGIEVPKNILIEWLTKGELKKLTIISVLGMGGLGKTTLVRKVYENQMVSKHFDCCIWITISESPVIRELLRKTIKEVLKVTKEQAPEGIDAMMDTNELINVLKHQLQKKRYVIIFDDIWHINVWEAMKYAFPDCDCGSRIMFTTRIGDVAECSDFIHNLEPLKEAEAWRLFCMKTFGGGSNHDNSGCCPKELKELSQSILKKCSGLPLAIVMIGGLLKRKAKTVWEWKNVHDSLGAEMRNKHKLESLERILMLSYNSLPCYLKPCFMYLSMFPEDYFIRRMTLIRMWIAEGFVEEMENKTMEAVAGEYVAELISRSMIQIAEFTGCHEVRSCRIHDLVRETILLKSKEECFSTANNCAHEMGNEKARRISIYHDTTSSSTGENNNCNYSTGPRCSNIRSLMVFQLDETPHNSFGTPFLKAFRLLRVLDLEGSDLAIFPPELVKLIHLRYLSLRRSTKITVLPKSIGKLKNLETLDLKETGVSELPVEILKLQRLRHLLVYHSSVFDLKTWTSDRYGVTVPTGRIGSLTCLQKLSYLDVQRQVGHDGGLALKELGMLTQLRRLGIMNLRSRRDGGDICLALQKMKHLDSLDIESSTTTTTTDVNKEEEEFLELESLDSPPQSLRHLYLTGRLRRLPGWISADSLSNLTALRLRYSRLSDDPLKAFQRMPNLVDLDIVGAYDGEKLCTTKVGGYQKLETLLLNKMEGLKRVRFRRGSMPMLRVLEIWDCPALEMVPLGIEHLSGLQELQLYRLHPELVKRISKVQGEAAQGEGGGEDCWKVQHISTIKCFDPNISGGGFACEDLNHFSLDSDSDDDDDNDEDDDEEEDNSQIAVEDNGGRTL